MPADGLGVDSKLGRLSQRACSQLEAEEVARKPTAQLICLLAFGAGQMSEAKFTMYRNRGQPTTGRARQLGAGVKSDHVHKVVSRQDDESHVRFGGRRHNILFRAGCESLGRRRSVSSAAAFGLFSALFCGRPAMFKCQVSASRGPLPVSCGFHSAQATLLIAPKCFEARKCFSLEHLSSLFLSRARKFSLNSHQLDWNTGARQTWRRRHGLVELTLSTAGRFSREAEPS